MFRTALIAAGLVGLTGVCAANAQTPAPFDVIAQAPRVCVLGQPALGNGQVVNFQGLDGSSLKIDTLVDPGDLAVRAALVTVNFDSVCNYPHRLVLRSQNNGLWRGALSGLTPEGFADAVPYGAVLEWGTTQTRFDVDASSRAERELSVDVGQATAGTLAIRLDIAPGASNLRRGSPLLAGVYQDTLRITVEPQ